MDEQLNCLFESFKQELKDIYTVNDSAILSVPGAWSGEASAEYINTLRILAERISDVIRRVEHLQEKVNVFVSSSSDTDTPI